MAAYFIPRQLQQLTDSAGKPLPDISTEEIGFLNGVTSPIQTQLNGKYGSGDAIVGVSFTIGANTLDANEWAYLDGQDQPVKTASSPTFANIMDSGNLDFGTTGARLSAASGILTLAGIGNTNNENLVFDFESVANSVVVSSGTGVTMLSFSGVSLQTNKYMYFGTYGDYAIWLKNNSATYVKAMASGNVSGSGGNDLIFYPIGSGASVTFRNYANTANIASFYDNGTVAAGALKLNTLPPIYANNAAAIAGGLTAGQVYRTGGDPDNLCIVH